MLLYLSVPGASWGMNVTIAPVKLLFKFQYASTPPASSNTDYAAARSEREEVSLFLRRIIHISLARPLQKGASQIVGEN